jgi:hypothetical protein
VLRRWRRGGAFGQELGGDAARVAPSARRRPILLRRSSTEMTIRLAIPIAPTSRATAPRPRKRAVEEPTTATRAASASEGRLRATSSGFGVGGRCEEVGDSDDAVRVGPDVYAAAVSVVGDQLCGDRCADEGGVPARRAQHVAAVLTDSTKDWSIWSGLDHEPADPADPWTTSSSPHHRRSRAPSVTRTGAQSASSVNAAVRRSQSSISAIATNLKRPRRTKRSSGPMCWR